VCNPPHLGPTAKCCPAHAQRMPQAGSPDSQAAHPVRTS
jgi:hypothetical protein